MTSKNRQRIENLQEPVESRVREEERKAQEENRRNVHRWHAYSQLEFWHLQESYPALAAEYFFWHEAIDAARDAIMGSTDWRDELKDSVALPDEIHYSAPALQSLHDASEGVHRRVSDARLARGIPLVPDEDLLQKAAALWKVAPDEVRAFYESRVLEDLIGLKEGQHGVDMDEDADYQPPTRAVVKAIADEEGFSFEALKRYFESHELNPAEIRGY